MDTLYNKVEVLETKETVGTGWLPPMPDLRDYDVEHKDIKVMAKSLGLGGKTFSIPATVDLRQWCSPIENQLNLGSCTAHAGVGIVEYFQRRAFGKHMEGSRLFVYKTTRNLMKVTGDTEAWLRNVMGALTLCGVADEKYWPYNVPDFDKEPSSFVYAIAAIGYDDNKKIKNTKCNKETTGALLIRNSWGTGWGDNGYGWLPYDYILNKLAMDFWSLLSMEWVDTKQFGI